MTCVLAYVNFLCKNTKKFAYIKKKQYLCSRNDKEKRSFFWSVFFCIDNHITLPIGGMFVPNGGAKVLLRIGRGVADLQQSLIISLFL